MSSRKRRPTSSLVRALVARFDGMADAERAAVVRRIRMAAIVSEWRNFSSIDLLANNRCTDLCGAVSAETIERAIRNRMRGAK